MQPVYATPFLLLFGSVAAAQQWSQPQSIIADAQLETRHDTTPKVTVAPDGTIAVAWISQYREGTSVTEQLFSNVQVSYSKTGGETWTAPAQISNASFYNSEIDINSDAADEFQLAWTSGDFFSGYRLHFAHTTDGGASYTTETLAGQGPINEYDHLNPQIAAKGTLRVLAKSSWYHQPPVIYFPTSRRLYTMAGQIWTRAMEADSWKHALYTDDPSHYRECKTLSAELLNTGGDNMLALFHQDYFTTTYLQQALVLTSTDSGQTWLRRGRISPDALQLRAVAAAYGANDTCIIAGTISNLDADSIWLAISGDKGVTWPETRTISLPENSVDYIAQPSIATDGSGNWLLTFYGEHLQALNYGSDGDIFYSMSADNGLTWSSITTLNPNADTDTAIDSNPTAADLGEGKWGIFWSRREDNNDSDIVIATIDTDGAAVADWQIF